VIEIAVPPLCARPEDIVPLARAFLAQHGGGSLSEKAVEVLLAYPWPGNVRELQNRVRRAQVVKTGPTIEPSDLDLPAAPAAGTGEPASERSELEALLRRHQGRVTRVAEELQMSRQALYRKMERLGIHTGRDLRERPLAFLQEHFGKAAAHFHAVARGEDHRPVQPDRPRKSAGSETTYPHDLGDPREVEAAIEALADEVWAWCERTGTFGRTVTVKLRYADFRTLTRSRTGAGPIASRSALAGAAVGLVRGVFPLEKKVRLLGVAVSGFGAGQPEDGHQIAFDFGQPG